MTQADDLALFSSQFVELASLIGDAMRYGPTPLLEVRYSKIRLWMMSHYRDVRPLIHPLLPARSAETTILGEAPDAVEGLFSAPTLGRLVSASSARLDRRISDVQSALEACGLVPARVVS